MIEADYLVVGAGAMGMGFTDALVEHDPDARVVMVDRRDGPGGHWRAAYPFVRLHQASQFYGVQSTVLGGRVQESGPEAGLHERADRATILAYYDDVLAALRATGRVELLTGHEVEGRTVVERETGRRFGLPQHCRVVDARYLAPEVPSEVPPRFAVDGARVVPVGDLPGVDDDPSRYVVVGSGKTATDAIVWLTDTEVGRGIDPGRITWVRPRDPWMLDRAVIQPDPVVYLGMVADMMRVASGADDLDRLFLDLEDAGIMMRLDPAVTPTMAKAPTLGRWELERLRQVEDVVRLGHVVSAGRGRLELRDGSVATAPDALVVNCAADGLRNRRLVPIWGEEAITLQPIRAGFPCFAAGLAGYVEATRDDDATKNRLCPPSSFGNSLTDWAAMQVRGFRASASFNAEPDIKAWADRVAINPSRVPPGHPGSPELDAALEQVATHVGPGLERLARLSGETAS
ncbi:NAD(P)-binding protein [Nocardioides sp. CFH 31398]|uniref:NAD(P)-binding protein n=1 Tax=Nocardioides sp. CFH 31398 TaxID=2919579 RepID=UPI001F0557D3|nr:NAD(P)-binding protein [Nocardioides sp. CFH 31398]MCH1866521.1 pyridine nucleotide-disulfide oxidoreductase [Nocardioides sp. CFH 31398]